MKALGLFFGCFCLAAFGAETDIEKVKIELQSIEKLKEKYRLPILQRSVVLSSQTKVKPSEGSASWKQYVLGVNYAKEGDLEHALSVFTALSKLRVDSLIDRRVKDLSILAIARIQSKQGLYRHAVMSYQKLPRESRYFRQMQFELATAYVAYGDEIRRQNFDLAQTAYFSAVTTLYRLVRSDASFGKQINFRVIYADLLERIGRTQKAKELYDRVRMQARASVNQLIEPKGFKQLRRNLKNAHQEEVRVASAYEHFLSNLKSEIAPHEKRIDEIMERLQSIKSQDYGKENADELKARASELYGEFQDIRSNEFRVVKKELEQQLAQIKVLSDQIQKASDSVAHIPWLSQREDVDTWLKRADLGMLNIQLTEKRQIDRRIVALEKAQLKKLVAIDGAL